MVKTLTAVSAALLAAAMVHAEAPAAGADVSGVIRRGLKAQGAAPGANQSDITVWKGKGKIELNGTDIKFTGSFAVGGPDRYRVDVEGDVFHYVLVVNRSKGWIKLNEETRDMEPERVVEEREQAYLLWISTLVPLLDPSFGLREAGRIDVAGHPARAVAVSHAGHRNVKLYFDEKTGVLLKNEMKVKRQGKERLQEMLYLDYHAQGGSLEPGRLKTLLDGKGFIDMKLSEVKRLAHPQPAAFSEP